MDTLSKAHVAVLLERSKLFSRFPCGFFTFTSSTMFGSLFGFNCVLICTIFTLNHDVQFYAVLCVLLHHVVPHQTMMRNSMNFYMFYCTRSSSNLTPLRWERKHQSTTCFRALKKDNFFWVFNIYCKVKTIKPCDRNHECSFCKEFLFITKVAILHNKMWKKWWLSMVRFSQIGL